MRKMISVLLTLAVAAVFTFCTAQSAIAQEVQFTAPRHVIYRDCNEEETKRLEFAVRYLRAASTTSIFDYGLRRAVDGRFRIRTSQEIDADTGQTIPFVGPYVPCDDSLQDPLFARTSSRRIGYDIVMNIARQNTRKRRLLLVCNDPNVRATAESPEGRNGERRWDYYSSTGRTGRTRFYEIRFNRRIFEQFPNHAVGETIDEAFGDLGDSYPVDELSGIILHEMLHNVSFKHGVADFPSQSCGYTTTSDDGFSCGTDGTCRMNSLNEIAEGVMSQVVQDSTDRCDLQMCMNADEIPIDYGLSTCRCEKFW